MITVRAPATIGNVGPGFDVLGLCVDGLHDEISLELSDHDHIIEVTGQDASRIPTDFTRNAAAIAAAAVRHKLRPDARLAMRIKKGLPSSGGLGGSAASSVGGALAAFALFGHKASSNELMMAALAGESAVAGRHLDNIAPCVLGGLTIVVDAHRPRIEKITSMPPWWLALVTPNLELSTKKARSVLPADVPRSEFVRNMANTSALVLAFLTHDVDLLGEALHDHFAEPRRAPLINGFFTAKDAALRAGAIGASISGAGPTTFAICEQQATAEKVADAMVAAYGDTRIRHVGKIGARGAEVVSRGPGPSTISTPTGAAKP